MQGELSRFAHGADEQTDAGHSQQRHRHARDQLNGLAGQTARLGKDIAVAKATGIGQQQTNAQNEAKVAHAVDQEGFEVGIDGGWLFKPEANEQVGDQAHRLPAKEELQKVVAHDQHEHAEGKERDVREEPGVAWVFFHVANGVDVDHQRDKGHHHHHGGRQAVDQKADFHADAADRGPGVDRAIKDIAAQHIHQDIDRGDQRDRHPCNGHPVTVGPTNRLPKEPRQNRAGQGGQCGQKIDRLHALAFQLVKALDLDGFEISKQDDQDGQTDR